MIPLNCKKHKMPQRHATHYATEGFTLVEMSIVLVVIGLLVGAIFVGRDVIHAAELRATIGQVDKYNSAVNTFILKFNCLPGDCATATDLGLAQDVGFATNGNGDGIIGICGFSPSCQWSISTFNTLGPEAFYFWAHLASAGLIDFSTVGTRASGPVAGIGSPKPKITAIGGGVAQSGWAVIADVPFDASFGGGAFSPHSLILANTLTEPAAGGDTASFAPADVFAIDSKIDDGLPFTGRVRTYNTIVAVPALSAGGAGGVGPGGPNAAVCVRNDTSPARYNIQYGGSASTGLCGIVIKATF